MIANASVVQVLRAWRPLVAASIALTCAVGVAAAQYPGVPPSGQMGMAGMPGAMGTKIPQTELTDASAKNAVDSYLAVKEKYGDETPTINPQKSSAEAVAQLQGLESIVKGYGFSDTGEWHTTVVSVALAYGFSTDNTRAELAESMAKIKDNPQLPAALKQQLVDVMKGMQPSDNNVKVVQGLLADDEYKAKLQQVNK